MFRQLYRAIRSGLLHAVIPQSRQDIFTDGKNGVEIVGFFRSASGIGESARLCAQQLRKHDVPVLCTSVEKYFYRKPALDWNFEDTATPDTIGCRIIHLNPPMIPPYAFLSGLGRFGSVYNIGYWAWEFEAVPKEWKKAARYMNAVMTPSTFSTKAIAAHTNKPVLTVPHPVLKQAPASDIRARLGLNDDAFLISNVFSYESAIERKYPEAIVKAFQAGLADITNARLVIKTQGGDSAALKNLARADNRILIADDIWKQPDIAGLIAASDVYISLHRSEGFGLTLAEAMLLGTPVVATGWSGNTDFCTPENSFPVDYTLIPIGKPAAPFSDLSGGIWAEPDIGHAARILRGIYDDPREAQRKSSLCLADANQYFSQPGYITALEKLAS